MESRRVLFLLWLRSVLRHTVIKSAFLSLFFCSLALVSPAFADDDSGPGGVGSPGSQGPGGESGVGVRHTDRPQSLRTCFFFTCKRKPPQRRRAAKRAKPIPVVSPEFVIWGALPEHIIALEQARYPVLARAELSGGRAILRVRSAPRISRNTALRRLINLAPGAVIGENVRYRSILRTSGKGPRSLANGRSFREAVSCSGNVAVAMIDTAVDLAHPAFDSSNLTRLDMRGPGYQPSNSFHGTAVASLIIGAANGPAPGLAPRIKLFAIDAFHLDSSGRDATDVFDLARALDHLGDHEARVVNMSLTGPNSPVIARAIEVVQAKGKLVVAAAGNEGPRAKPVYPAAYPEVIAVAALDPAGNPWRFSARGAHIGFAAAGVDLTLAGRNGQPEIFSGTSFSAPIVTTMLAAKIKNNPDSSSQFLRDQLIGMSSDRGDPGRDPVYGYGVLDPFDACKTTGMPESSVN